MLLSNRHYVIQGYLKKASNNVNQDNLKLLSKENLTGFYDVLLYETGYCDVPLYEIGYCDGLKTFAHPR
jgi:uncharacterized protein (DUF2237 family)